MPNREVKKIKIIILVKTFSTQFVARLWRQLDFLLCPPAPSLPGGSNMINLRWSKIIQRWSNIKGGQISRVVKYQRWSNIKGGQISKVVKYNQSKLVHLAS